CLVPDRVTDQGAVFTPSADFPDPQLVAVDLGSQPAVIQTETERDRRRRQRAEELSAGARVPEPQDALPAVARQQVASVVESNTDAGIPVPLQHPRLRPGGH